MKDLAIDQNTGDLVVNNESGDFELVENDRNLQQKIYSLLNTNTGELSWNDEIGIDFLELINVSKDKNALQKIIYDYLDEQLDYLSDVEIIDTQLDRADRILYIELNITLSYGTIINTEIGGEENAN